MTAEGEIFLAPTEASPSIRRIPARCYTRSAARGLTANALALKLRVPANRLTEILNSKRGISPDTPLRLSHYSA